MRVLRLNDVIERTTLSRASIYRLESRGLFPERIQISTQKIGWFEEEIDDWLLSRPKTAPGLILDETEISRPIQILCVEEVIALTTLASSTLVRNIQKATFPASVRLATRKKGWLEHEVHAWLKTRRRPLTMRSPEIARPRQLETV